MAKSRSEHSWFNLMVILALCLGSFSYGYDFSIISTTLGQPNFYAYFDLTLDPTDHRYAFTNQITGAMNGLFSAGAMFGALFMGWLCDARGRRVALVASALIAIVGGALQGGSVHIAMMLVARFVTGYSAGMLATLIPVFQAEIAPPASRGFLVGQHGFVLVGAYGVAGWVGYGSYFAANPQFQWRFPLAMQCLFPILLLLAVHWIPESPRWLLTRGRTDEAWEIVERLHRNAADPEHTFASQEFFQMTEQVAADNAAYGDITLLDLFRKPNYRKRMICGAVTMWAAEASGNLVIYNYSVILYQGLGYTGSIPLLLSAVYVTYAAFGNYVCSLLLDSVGRVRLMVIGFIGCLVCLCCESAMVAEYAATLTNEAGLRAGVFFLFFFVTFYGGCCDATTFVYCSEIFPTHIRPKGMAFSIAILFLATIPFLEAAPTAFAQVGWKYYILFILLTLINIIVIAFYFPETKGLSLEEINEVFGDEVAVYLTHATEEEKAVPHENPRHETHEKPGERETAAVHSENTSNGHQMSEPKVA